jgi:hypothetical protein
VIVNVISPAPKDIWDKVLAEDPFALEGQASAGTITVPVLGLQRRQPDA